MKRMILAAALTALVAASAAAQVTKTIQGEMKTVTATIEAIEKGTRQITLKEQDGTYATIVAGPEVKKFDQLKVGDKITARYYDNVVLRLKLPGEKAVDTDSAALSGGAKGPGATAATQRTITATITQIDQKVPSITFTGPNNWTYSSRVEDKEALKKVKVGDRVDITWTEAVLISVE